MEVVETGQRSIVPVGPTTGQQMRVHDVKIDNVKFVDCPGTTIGTRVDCQGDLIVNQFLRVDGCETAEPVNLNLKALKELLVKDSTCRFSWKKVLNSRILFVSFGLTILIAGGIIGAVQLVRNVTNDSDGEFNTLPWNYTARLRSRGIWAANEFDITESMVLTFRPAKYVIVAHTAGPDCNKPMNCDNIVKGIQNYHIKEGYGDIGLHFLIGGDGFIYEGLGWGKYGSHSFGFNCDSIAVAFIGDYDVTKLKSIQIDAFKILIEEGLRVGEINPNYKLFSHSQVFNANSPGLHIKEVIRTWNHSANVIRDDYICGDSLPMNYTSRLLSRGNWTANEINVTSEELPFRPAKFIIVSHTGGADCNKPEYCGRVVKGIQSYDIKQNYNDIKVHFLIGGDGYIYEGLGWGKKGSHTFGFNCDSIGVAFIGDYDVTRLRAKQVNAFNILIDEGLKLKEIDPNYKLFARFQVFNSNNPGLYIKEVINSWSHSAEVAKEDFICPLL